MKHTSMIALLLASLFSGLAAGQEEELENPFRQEDPREEMTRLFHEIERTLDAISDQLFDAGAGDTQLDDVSESGLLDLLKDTGSKSGEAIAGIDRILKLAAEMAQSSSSSPSPPSGQGESLLDGKGKGGPRQREETPEGPRQGEQGKSDGEKEGEQNSEDGKPKSDNENPSGGDNRDGDPQEAEPGQPIPRPDDKDRWGMLPERVRGTFQNQGGDELPVQYRDWIDAYYRRLNERP